MQSQMHYDQIKLGRYISQADTSTNQLIKDIPVLVYISENK